MYGGTDNTRSRSHISINRIALLLVIFVGILLLVIVSLTIAVVVLIDNRYTAPTTSASSSISATPNTTTLPTSTTTKYTTAIPAMATTTFVPPILMINDVTSVIYQSVEMSCVVSNLPTNWTSLVVSSDVRGPIATFPYKGTVVEHASGTFGATGSKSETSASLNITMDNQASHCTDKGTFTCTLVTPGHENYTDTARLDITAHPTSTISDSSPYSEGAESTISCVGVLPAGTGSLSLQIKPAGGTVFTEFNTVTPTITDGGVTTNCTVTRTVTYTFTPTLQFNGTEAKCVANNSALTGSSANSATILIVVNQADIAFNAYDRKEEVGSSNIVIGCYVRSAQGWTNVKMTRKTTGSSSATTIFSLDKSGTPSQPLAPRGSYVHTEDDSSLSVSITLSILDCVDRGEYTCTATGASSPLTTNMTFAIYKNPETPILTLHPDQIENLMFQRGGFEHQCLAEVGFPSAGNLTVVYKMKGQSTFVPFKSVRIIQYDTNTMKTSCGTTKYFKFGLNFTSADKGGEVKCVATNQELGVTTESAVGTLELIPRQYCNTTDAPKHLHHPTNCNKYVQCQGRYPYGNQCPNADQCADITTDNVVCKSCEGVVCPWNITTTTPGPTTTTLPPPSSQIINCTDETVFIGDPVTLTCNMTAAFDYINITKATRNIADVISGGNVVNRNVKTGEQVVFSQSSLKISYDSAECDDGGQFTIDVSNTGGSTESQAVTLTIWAKPHSVSMTPTPDFIANIDRLGSEHVCEGYVGYPGGQLEVTMTKPGDTTVYSVPLADYDGTRSGGETITFENCNNKARLEFGLKLGLEWQNGTITCRAKNGNVLQAGDKEQNDSAIIQILPSDFCNGESDNTFKANPYNCNNYVQCFGGQSYGRGCGVDCFTGLQVAPLCGDCQTYPCSITPTTSELIFQLYCLYGTLYIGLIEF
ncbi:uncharacterized protein LOC117341947 [Pecten maximus]|uniref:uncharacterized protein LOC117341947 n=1 Tax=Pecten maximus TaxID=6579 RepID=UPI0014585E1E|nr:uncharacterized protein LOC117341947 [Pecten maximus]